MGYLFVDDQVPLLLAPYLFVLVFLHSLVNNFIYFYQSATPVRSTMAAMTYTTIELATPNGPEYRRVSTKPPRLPEEDEMPVIDLGALNGDFAARRELASQFRTAAEKTGFFYVRNHGIPEDLIQSALSQIQTFFEHPEETKESISLHHAGQTLGYLGVGGSQINNTESRGM
jgi:hypothetical protein